VATPTVPSAYLLTYDDWLRMSEDDGRLYELIDGEFFVTPSPNILHQRVTRELGVRLANYLQRSGAGEVLFAPTGVRLDDASVLEPDLLVVLREHAAIVGTQVIEGPPDLVVEVLSPGTARRDIGLKREKYRSRRIREYWIVDPVNGNVEVLVLEDEADVLFGRFTRKSTLRSSVLPDLEISLADVFRTE
jgi:Uma2 family endonuclease